MLLAEVYFFNYFSQMQPETSPNYEHLSMCNIEYFVKYFQDKVLVVVHIPKTIIRSLDLLTED